MCADRVLVDANILVYALYRDAVHHAASRGFLERSQSGEFALCLTSQVLAEFFSIVTNPKRVSNPRTPEEAAAAIQAMLTIPGVAMLPVPSEVTSRWLDLLSRHPVHGGAVFDLQLIATMAANGVERICTFNREDFEGFSGLQVLTPS